MPSTRERPAGRMSLHDYLVWEEQNTIKHEYVAGEVYAMSGVTVRHNLITLNIVRALHAVARARGCHVLATDVKLRAGSDRIYYPDVMMVCGAAASVELIVDAPSLVVEVTSPSTRATDRREKVETYMKLASMRTYLVVEQRRRQVLVYTCGKGSDWTREEITGSGEARIAFLDASLSLDDIYEDVPLPPLAVGEEEEWYDLEDEPE
jgi:Uma2 family endonuclease